MHVVTQSRCHSAALERNWYFFRTGWYVERRVAISDDDDRVSPTTQVSVANAAGAALSSTVGVVAGQSAPAIAGLFVIRPRLTLVYARRPSSFPESHRALPLTRTSRNQAALIFMYLGVGEASGWYYAELSPLSALALRGVAWRLAPRGGVSFQISSRAERRMRASLHNQIPRQSPSTSRGGVDQPVQHECVVFVSRAAESR